MSEKLQSPTKVITITEGECKQYVYDALSDGADREGINIIAYGASIIDKALSNKDEYNKPLSRAIKDKPGKKIVIRVAPDVKDKFNKWADEKKRTQTKHAAFLLEKWCELEGFIPPRLLNAKES